MSIEEYIQDKDNLTNSIESKINKSQKRLKSLMEDPKVIEYLKEEAELKRLEKKKYKKEKEFQLSYQETCVHPFFALIGCKILTEKNMLLLIFLSLKMLDLQKTLKDIMLILMMIIIIMIWCLISLVI